MARYRRQFCVEVMTPEHTIYAADALSVVVPLTDGDYGVLGGHAPLIAIVGAGEFHARNTLGELRRFFVSGGLLHVRHDAVTVLVEEWSEISMLNLAEAQRMLEKAEAMPVEDVESESVRDRAMQNAQSRLRLARLLQGRQG